MQHEILSVLHRKKIDERKDGSARLLYIVWRVQIRSLFPYWGMLLRHTLLPFTFLEESKNLWRNSPILIFCSCCIKERGFGWHHMPMTILYIILLIILTSFVKQYFIEHINQIIISISLLEYFVKLLKSYL